MYIAEKAAENCQPLWNMSCLRLLWNCYFMTQEHVVLWANLHIKLTVSDYYFSNSFNPFRLDHPLPRQHLQQSPANAGLFTLLEVKLPYNLVRPSVGRLVLSELLVQERVRINEYTWKCVLCTFLRSAIYKLFNNIN